MQYDYTSIALYKNDDDHRFEINIDGYLAFIDFKELGNQIALIHTEAAKELAGKGAAKAVVEKTMTWIEDNRKTLLPFCPYVFAYIKKHPEWKRIVDTRFKAYDKL